MNENIYVLNFPAEKIFIKNKIRPEISVICALIYALSVSICKEFYVLIFASLPAMIFLFKDRKILAHLTKINFMNLIMIITLALTWSEIREGFMTGILIALRVNIIFIIFAGMVLPLGISGIYEALFSLGIPEKLRILIILTLRGIFILRERFEKALISVRLRAPTLKGIMKFKILAYITASVLLKSSDHSEKIARAIKCRGGFGGFNIHNKNKSIKNIERHEIIYFMCFMFYAFLIIILNYA